MATKDNLIIYRKEKEIQKELAEAKKWTHLFQPFIDELFRTGLKEEPDINVIRNLILTYSLEGFLKREALLLDEGISKMKISLEKKLDLIEPELFFDNYKTLQRLYKAIPIKEYERFQINNYILDEANQLVSHPSSIAEIINKHTVRANSETEKETYLKACELLDAFKTLQEDTGFDLAYFGSIYKGGTTISSWIIDPYVFNQQMLLRSPSN